MSRGIYLLLAILWLAGGLLLVIDGIADDRTIRIGTGICFLIGSAGEWVTWLRTKK